DVSMEIAGLGGERFLKAEARERWYHTFLRSKALGDFTYSVGGTLGYGLLGEGGVNGDELPLFERYFPGGISSIRGFKARTLGPRRPALALARRPPAGPAPATVPHQAPRPEEPAAVLVRRAVPVLTEGHAESADGRQEDRRSGVGGARAGRRGARSRHGDGR